MRKLSLLIVILIFISSILSGCSDIIEIDENIYPLVIGVDSGVNNKIRLTIQFSSYKGASGGTIGSSSDKGGGGGGEKNESGEVDGTVVTTVEASTILEGINLLNTWLARTVSLTHSKMLIFSEEFARKGVGNYLAPMMRYRETRRVMHVVVCRGKAEDFIKENKSTIGASAIKSIELMATQSINSGLFPRVTFLDFYRAMLSPYRSAHAAYAGINDLEHLKDDNNGVEAPINTYNINLPGELPRKGAAKREFVGTAVFEGDKMVGWLNSDETRYLQMITGELKRAIVSTEDKNKPGTTLVADERLGRKPVIKAYFEKGIPIIDVKINIEADLGAIQSRINYEKLDRIEEINAMYKERIEKGVKQTIEKAQKEFKADIFGFGYKVAGNFLTIPEWKEYNWHKHFQEAKVNVSVDFNVRRTGLMFGSEPILGTGEQIGESLGGTR